MASRFFSVFFSFLSFYYAFVGYARLIGQKKANQSHTNTPFVVWNVIRREEPENKRNEDESLG